MKELHRTLFSNGPVLQTPSRSRRNDRACERARRNDFPVGVNAKGSPQPPICVPRASYIVHYALCILLCASCILRCALNTALCSCIVHFKLCVVTVGCTEESYKHCTCCVVYCWILGSELWAHDSATARTLGSATDTRLMALGDGNQKPTENTTQNRKRKQNTQNTRTHIHT